MFTYHRIWQMVGSGVRVDEAVGAWFSKFLGVEGCSVFYMGPQHKGRVLQTDSIWGEDAGESDEVRGRIHKLDTAEFIVGVDLVSMMAVCLAYLGNGCS